jgi:hypothetical protein
MRYWELMATTALWLNDAWAMIPAPVAEEVVAEGEEA